MNPSEPIRRLLSDRGGSAALEFALALPILIGLTVTAFDAGRYILLKSRLQDATWTMADAATRALTLGSGEALNIVQSGERLMAPFGAAERSRFIASGVTGSADGPPTVRWQVAGGGLAEGSRIGATGGTAELPDGVTLAPGESVVIVEGVYSPGVTLPLQEDLFPAFRDIALARPRVGELTELD
ncbi:MAG: hypothetical protein TEF_10230 [Rhizobiales bacterium NRL2]|jgi:hypothetical protein|nr:MAG: hypothetical protein TEF_10230 [Rhizobiales bacterium NRL2]